jgi:hypothetical protein
MNERTATSHSDSQYRDLEYVECRTFKGNECVKTTIVHYPPNEAYNMFRKVVNKYSKLKERVLICHRKENHELINSHLI